MRRPLLGIVAMLGAAVIVAGLWFAQPQRSASFGWTAYTPLSETTAVLLLASAWWSLALLAAGSAAFGAAIALLIDRRPARRDPPE